MPPSQVCPRCGSPRPQPGGNPGQPARGEAVDRAWARALRHTVAFVVVGQALQTVQMARDGLTAWAAVRWTSTLLVGTLVAWGLSRRSVRTLRVWGGVVMANLPVMAGVLVWALLRAETQGLTLWMTALAWVTVAAYLASLRRVRGVVAPRGPTP